VLKFCVRDFSVTSIEEIHVLLKLEKIPGFTFMLPYCIVIDFLLNNQPDALIIQIYSVIKLYTLRASSLPNIRSFLLYIQHW